MKLDIHITIVLSALSFGVCGFGSADPLSASAFPHVAQREESLSTIAERYYGDSKRETVIAVANSLDAYGGSMVQPGMRIEIPAPSFVRVHAGDTWTELARVWLGSTERAAWLSRTNGQKPWIPPSPGQEIRIPAVVTHISTEGESILTLHKKFEKDIEHAWELNGYNFRDGVELKPGDIVLVPLLELTLSERGRKDARVASQAAMGDYGDFTYATQQNAERMLPTLLLDLQHGRYLDVIRHGAPLVDTASLSRAQQSQVYRALMEAYTAVDALGAAADACDQWSKTTDNAVLDPNQLSPKIMRACLSVSQ
jgi:LysM domain